MMGSSTTVAGGYLPFSFNLVSQIKLAASKLSTRTALMRRLVDQVFMVQPDPSVVNSSLKILRLVFILNTGRRPF